MHSRMRAVEEAVKLWAYTSAQYSKHDVMLSTLQEQVVESLSTFAMNARRALEALPDREKSIAFKCKLYDRRWEWKPTVEGGKKVDGFKRALNDIIHASALEVGLTELPENLSVISGGLAVPYVRVKTGDDGAKESAFKEPSFIDIFALAYAFLYHAYPLFGRTQKELPPFQNGAADS